MELETVGTDSKQELHMIKDRKENGMFTMKYA